MANPQAEGRMLRREIAASPKIAALSPQAAVLFFMIIKTCFKTQQKTIKKHRPQKEGENGPSWRPTRIKTGAFGGKIQFTKYLGKYCPSQISREVNRLLRGVGEGESEILSDGVEAEVACC